jgi:hypothetical protein
LNHRRPSHDELTPEDLFRPEPVQAPQAGGTTIPGEVVRSSEMPWNAPPQPEYYGEAPAAYPAPQQYQPEVYQAPQPPQVQQYGQAQYPQQPGEEASTQFMPPFPAEAQQTQQQPYGGYQQGPQQGYAQQAPQQGYGQQAPQQGYGQQAPPPQGPGYATGAPNGPARRFSPKMIAIAVVAACAVIGVVVGVAASGGGTTAGAAGGPGTPTASADASAQASGSGVNQAQAKALSDLLTSAASSRSSVIGAVYDIDHCQNLADAAQNLTTAAGVRGQLVTQLGTLQTGGLPQGTALVAALKQGWEASRDADTHYAAWAKASKSSCAHSHQPKAGGDRQAAGADSTATVAKAKASRLWDAIASKTGLPKRSKSQL